MEFALVLPMLLVLLLGIADFGRVFAAGITLEAAARDAAEAAAQEYLQLIRNKTGGVLDADDYQHVHDVATDTACAEGAALPTGTSGCKLAVASCVHDNLDVTLCGSEAATAPVPCSDLRAAWNPSNDAPTPSGATALPYVEVRLCYQFTTLINLSDLRLPFGWGLSLGSIWLEKGREFTVANY